MFLYSQFRNGLLFTASNKITNGNIREETEITNIPDGLVEFDLVKRVAFDKFKFTADDRILCPDVVHNLNALNEILSGLTHTHIDIER